MDSFRCIHAARLLLDHQFPGFQFQGPGSSLVGGLAPDVRQFIEDATLLAFEHVVDQALALDVHCVLISGDSFDPHDRSLRGPAALVRGIGRLAEHDVAVVLQSASPDLWSHWPAGLRFPPNAHRLGSGLPASVSIAREGKLLATIAVDDGTVASTGASTGATAGEMQAPQYGPAMGRCGWQIHLPAAHQPGANAPGANAPGGTIHLHETGWPGYGKPVQGLCPEETGSHGFTLIEIDAQGEPHHQFIPAAPVRWERFSLDVSDDTQRDDLLQDMASRLEQSPRQPCEKVWLIAWDVSGTGPLFDRMLNRTFSQELLTDLADLDPTPGVQIQTHALRLHSTGHGSRPNSEHGVHEHGVDENGAEGNREGLETQAPEQELAAEFAMRLEERFADPRQALAKSLAGSSLAGCHWGTGIESLLAGLDGTRINHDARCLALQWFAGQRVDEQGERLS